jgi:hypothetical protein
VIDACWIDTQCVFDWIVAEERWEGLEGGSGEGVEGEGGWGELTSCGS